MNHQRKRLPERLDQQPRGNIRDDHHWNDPAENYAEQSWENRVRITRNVQKIKIAVDQSLSAHDPETDRGQAQHYGIMHRYAKAERGDVKQDGYWIRGYSQARQGYANHSTSERGVDDAIQPELFRGY